VCPEQLDWNAVTAIATLLAVIVALFGKQIRAFLFPPMLKIRRKNKYGEKILGWQILNDQISYDVVLRFFHIRVDNARRLTSSAHDVQLFLIRLEEKAPNGNWQTRWAGSMPLRWRDQELTSSTQTVGPSKDADLLMVSEPIAQLNQAARLSLKPQMLPGNFGLKTVWQGPCHFIATLQARSITKDSNQLRLEVSWDGHWEEGDIEMYQHLKVDELPNTSAGQEVEN
jgi:hypothetical protein